MTRRLSVRILVVEADRSTWSPIEAFFVQQLAQVGPEARVAFRERLPQRVAGFDLVSLPERQAGARVVDLLLDRPDLLADLRDTPIVNLHAARSGRMHADMRVLLDRGGAGLSPDGLWVLARDWMAPWFETPLGFPELGLAAPPTPALPHVLPQPAPAAATADRTWDRRGPRAADRPRLGPVGFPLPA